MHPNRAFRQADRTENLAFARSRGFGVLMLSGGTEPLASHIPFAVGEDGTGLEAHIVRSNPIRARLEAAGEAGVRALIAVSGPDAYISPDWYGTADQVPTWNYVAVHLRGCLTLGNSSDLSGHLARLSANFEARVPNKEPWTLDKLSNEAFERMTRMILPVFMAIDDVQGTWKLSQNKPDMARSGAADGLAESGEGFEIDKLIRLMTSDAL